MEEYYSLSYYSTTKGYNQIFFDYYPSSDDLAFLIDSTDIVRATLWHKVHRELIRVYDII